MREESTESRRKTYHAGVGASLLRLEEDSFFMTASRTCPVGSRQLKAEKRVSALGGVAVEGKRRLVKKSNVERLSGIPVGLVPLVDFAVSSNGSSSNRVVQFHLSYSKPKPKWKLKKK